MARRNWFSDSFMSATIKLKAWNINTRKWEYATKKKKKKTVRKQSFIILIPSAKELLMNIVNFDSKIVSRSFIYWFAISSTVSAVADDDAHTLPSLHSRHGLLFAFYEKFCLVSRDFESWILNLKWISRGINTSPCSE